MTKQKKPKRNRALFDKIAAAIAAQPHHYDQETFGEQCQYSCGTAHCIAGWAAKLTGHRPKVVYPKNESRPAVPIWSTVFAKGKEATPGNELNVVDVARDALGITETEASSLFAAGWEPDGVVHSVTTALRALGRGASIESVTRPGHL